MRVSDTFPHKCLKRRALVAVAGFGPFASNQEITIGCRMDRTEFIDFLNQRERHNRRLMDKATIPEVVEFHRLLADRYARLVSEIGTPGPAYRPVVRAS